MKVIIKNLFNTKVFIFSILLTLLVSFFVTPATAEKTSQQPTVVILTDSISWEDVNEQKSPTLINWAKQGTIFNVVSPSFSGWYCPLDSVLAMNAGKPLTKTSVANSPSCPNVISSTETELRSWARIRVEVKKNNPKNVVELGKFSTLLNTHDIKFTTIGEMAGALLSNSEGELPKSFLQAPQDNNKLATTVATAINKNPLTFVDTSLTNFALDPFRESATVKQSHFFTEGNNSDLEVQAGSQSLLAKMYREQQTEKNLLRLERTLQEIPTNAIVYVVSLQSISSAKTMQIGFISHGITEEKSNISGLGWSIQTRQKGNVTLTGIIPTLLEDLGIKTTEYSGGISKITDKKCDNKCFAGQKSELLNSANQAHKIRLVRGLFYKILTSATISFLLLATILLWGKSPLYRIGTWRGVRKIFAIIGLTISAAPLASHLLTANYEWWNSNNYKLLLIGGTWAVALTISLLVLPTRHKHPTYPFISVGAATAAVLLIDVATGSRVLSDAPMGFDTLLGARFYGLGNEAFALLGTGTFLLFSGVLITLHNKVSLRICTLLISIAGVGIIGVIILPTMGADFGGGLALTPSLLLFLLLISERKVSLKKLFAIGCFAVALVATVSLLDWMRPDSTHLGNFVQAIIDGDAQTIVWRKISVNWRLLHSSTHRHVVLSGAIFILLVLVPWLRKSNTQKEYQLIILKHAGFAIGLCLFIAFAVNDSGIVLPGMGFILGLPALASTFFLAPQLTLKNKDAYTACNLHIFSKQKQRKK